MASEAAPGRSGFAALTENLRASPSFLPCLLATFLFVWFAGDEAGFTTTTWYPGALCLLGLLTLSLAALPTPRPSTATLLAVGLLAGYAIWSLLSIAWARHKGIAWDGANRTVLYALVLALFALWPMRAGAAALLIGGWALAVVGIGLVELLRASAEVNPSEFFFERRLVEPAGYVNANVALWFGAFWPCIVLAARREVHPVLRGAFLGGAVVLCGLALLGQSRGWLISAPVLILLALLIVPGRARTLVTLAVVGAAVAVVSGPLVDVYEGSGGARELAVALDEAVRALIFATLGVALLGMAVGWMDRVRPIAERTERRADLVAAAAVAAGLVLLLVAFTVRVGNPVSEVADYWDEFKEGGTTPAAGEARLTGTAATDRYDFWRVGWEMFTEQPVGGFGADNFQQEYFVRGEGDQQPRYPHSLPVRVLSQTGLVGALLLAASIAAALVAAAGALLRSRDLAAGVAAAGVLVAAYWLVHGSLDWLWEFPGLGAPAFAALGLAAALGDGGRGLPGVGRRPRVVIAIGVAATIALAASLTGPWLAEVYVRHAGQVWQTQPAAAGTDLDRARQLNPLSPIPDLTRGTIAVRRARLEEARGAFLAALGRDERDAYAHLQLAAIASEQGRRDEALRRAALAVELNPRYDVSRQVLRALRRGRRLTAEEVNRLVALATRTRIGLQGDAPG